ncbi:hypothetical protein A3D11_01395 [Candidatus Peribacteria bacterium RIFCSPHIGHO2_02_FULL_49_16]|nr:MAG: hypothetical protein A2880_00590 [Candidatus Peribacteria bacterium RIFCSPHIGHO2_01_FULL_49_38]OGJ59682.1 MAG: hypothetical protein A3D11_01395 [Candidatus Peribacteria bacterium RIFCSPHIGHO2_02_FULL_49_16]
MRIVLVTPEYVTERTFDGGLANYLHRLALALHRLGHEPIIVLPTDWNETYWHKHIRIERRETWTPLQKWKKPYTVIRILDHATFHIFCMAIHLVWRSWRLNRRVKQLNRERPVDLIHYTHLGGFGALRPRRIPAVVRLSSSTKLCQQFGGYGERNWQVWQQERMERLALRKADAVFGPSIRIARLTEHEIGRPVRVIESPFFVETEHVDPSAYKEHLRGKTYLLFFGSIGLIKGIGTIAEMIHPLLAAHPDLHFAFVGKRVPRQSGGDLMDRVFDQAGEHRDRVLWLPSQPHETLYPIIEHAHAVILPSRVDNFPNACIESMAFRRVVVGTRGNGFEQLINDGASGFLCAVDDSADLLRACERVLALSDVERKAMGERAYERTRELLPENSIPKLIDFYLDAIECFRKKRF